MPPFLEDQFAVLRDANRTQHEHNRVCRLASSELAKSLSERWSAPGAAVAGSVADAEFERGRFPEADTNQTVECHICVTLGGPDDLKWRFFVPVSIRRFVHGVMVSVNGGQRHLVNSAGTPEEYKFQAVMHEVEKYVDECVQEESERRRLKP